MIQQGCSVPPPLRRGGSQKISTGPSIASSRRPTKVPTQTAPRRASTKKASKASTEDTDPEEFDSDSDAEYGKPRAKRIRATPKCDKHSPTPSTGDSDESIGTSNKRVKREMSTSSNDEVSLDGDVKHKDGVGDEEIVAAGAGFLGLVNDAFAKSPASQDSARSLIVKLSVKPSLQSLRSSSMGRNCHTQASLDHHWEIEKEQEMDPPALASGETSAYTQAYPAVHYPGSDISLQRSSNHWPSSFGGLDGLRKSSFHGEMTGQPEMPYSNEINGFSGMHVGDDNFIGDNIEWAPTNSDYQIEVYDHASAFTAATASFGNCYGPSQHSVPSLPQLSTSFVSQNATQEDTSSGDYMSAGPSTINHTPSASSLTDVKNLPWSLQDSFHRERPANAHFEDLNLIVPNMINRHQYEDSGNDYA